MAITLFPSSGLVASSFAQPSPANTASFLGGSNGQARNFFPSSFPVAGVLDDAKNKAKDIEASTKDAASSAYNSASKEVSKLGTEAKAKSQPGNTGKIPLYSAQYYSTCVLGGILACGTTHALVTPLDLVKCRRQVDKSIYKGNVDGWKKIWATEGGLGGIYTGVGPTLVGYSMQGAAKYGFYEFFKKKYADAVGPENAVKYKDAIYLAGSASAEFLADIALVPMEAVKVRMQTTIPPFAPGLVSATRKFAAVEGVGGFYRSLPSLWSRQIPYTMMKFWSFEATVNQIYKYLGKPASEYNKLQQLGVSFVGGYTAGVFCAVVSHPADVMVSKLNAPTKDGSKPSVGVIYKDIGFSGLWAGLGTRIVMIGTLTALQWLIYDYIKVAAGLPTTGSAPAPEKK